MSVAPPISAIESVRSARRPIRSPTLPSTTLPNGRATNPSAKSQYWTWSVTTSADPIAENAAASRIGTTGGYDWCGTAANTRSSKPPA